MEIYLTDCFCNEKPTADQDINLAPIESTTSRVEIDRRSRCCSSFVICPSSLFQLSGFQTKKIWMRMRMAMMKSTMVSMHRVSKGQKMVFSGGRRQKLSVLSQTNYIRSHSSHCYRIHLNKMRVQLKLKTNFHFSDKFS